MGIVKSKCQAIQAAADMSALDKLCDSMKEVQSFMESVRKAEAASKCQTSLLETRLTRIDAATGDSSKKKDDEARLSELDLSLKKANLHRAKLHLEKEELGKSLQETIVDLHKGNARIMELEQQLKDSNQRAEAQLNKTREVMQRAMDEALTKQELQHELQLSEMERKNQLQVSELEKKNECARVDAEEKATAVRQSYEKQMLSLEERNIDLSLNVKELKAKVKEMQKVKEAAGSGGLPMSAPVITPLPRDPRKRPRGVKGDTTATAADNTASSEQGRGSSSMYFAAASNPSTPQRQHERASPAATPVSSAKRKRVSFPKGTPDNEGKTAGSWIGHRLRSPKHDAKAKTPKQQRDDSVHNDANVSGEAGQTAKQYNPAKKPLFDFDHNFQ